MLPQAATLLPFVAKQLRYRKPADRLLERLDTRGDHARQRRRHLGPEGDVAIALVSKRIQLLHDLVAALLRVHLERFEGRTVVFVKAIARGHAPPDGDDVVAIAPLCSVPFANGGEAVSL